MNYKDLYEKLYRIGYHSKMKNHGANYVDYISQNYKFKRILDIGCSNGVAVHKFKKQRKESYGIDVAHIAIRYAAEKTLVPNCIMADASDLPFKDGFFDAIFSCDVLEHLERRDVGKAISEMMRVCKGFLFIVIDCDVERNREWIQKAKKEFPADFARIENLHLTVMPFRRWRRMFESAGAKYLKEHEGLYIFTTEK